MAKKSPSGPDPRAKQWFAAASRHDRARLGELLADGFDVNCRDSRGRTALFYVIAPYGGNPELVEWLVDKGADVNVRDSAGESALDFGSGGVSSALEANMIAWVADLFYERGYPRPSPRPAPRPAKRKLSDFWGRWVIDGGGNHGQEIRISSRRIGSDVRSLRLAVDEVELDERGRMVLRGEHATELVTVTILIKSTGRAILRWSDGIMGPLPDIQLER